MLANRIESEWKYMKVFNDSNWYEGYVEKLKSDYTFDQVLFTGSNKHFITFDCLKDGESFEVRYDREDQEYEMYVDGKWHEI